MVLRGDDHLGRAGRKLSLRGLHGDLAWVVVLANLGVGAWALGAHRYASLRHRALWWCTIAAEVLIFVEVILGVVLMNRDDVEVPEIHTFYGFSTLIIIGLIYSSQQQIDRSRRYLLYGCGSLFLMGTLIRTMTLS